MALQKRMVLLLSTLALYSWLSLGLAAPADVMSCTGWSGEHLCHVDQTGVITVGVLNGSVGAMSANAQYYHGYFTTHLKFPGNDSEGTITAFYLADTVTNSNKDKNHFEIDIEFYGNKDPNQIMMATNVFFGGEQNLAQFKLPFDPSKEFHSFSIVWNQKSIAWLMDNRAVRILSRSADHAWPNAPLLPLLTVWQINWGDAHPDYSNGPITTQVREFQIRGCAFSSPTARGACPAEAGVQHSWNRPLSHWQLAGLTPTGEGAINQNLLLNAWGWDKA